MTLLRMPRKHGRLVRSLYGLIGDMRIDPTYGALTSRLWVVCGRRRIEIYEDRWIQKRAFSEAPT